MTRVYRTICTVRSYRLHNYVRIAVYVGRGKEGYRLPPVLLPYLIPCTCRFTVLHRHLHDIHVVTLEKAREARGICFCLYAFCVLSHGCKTCADNNAIIPLNFVFIANTYCHQQSALPNYCI
jgi:hypothetical protein